MTDEKKAKPRDLGLPSRKDLGSGIRMVKMLRAECPECEDPSRYVAGWWTKCPHDPYYSQVQKTEQVPAYEDLPNGRRKLVSTDTITYAECEPNLEQVALSVRINSGKGVEWARARGWILPESHPTRPLLAFCQYANCWSQKILFKGPHGDYCDEMQAKVIKADELQKTMEILHQPKRAEQFASITV